MSVLPQDSPMPDSAFPNSLLGVGSGAPSILTSHLRARPRVTRTFAVLKQCAWCGAMELAGRFYLHHRLSTRGRVFQFRLFSWVMITVGISHGLCGRCADDLRRDHRAESSKAGSC